MRNEINEKLARLDGWNHQIDHELDVMLWRKKSQVKVDPPNYCKDLNLLMPLAWKYKVKVECRPGVPVKMQWAAHTADNVLSADKDPKQAIIECLLKIAEEG